MDDRDRTAPVALARDPPVAEAIVDLTCALRRAAENRVLEPARHLFLGFLDRHAVEEVGVDVHAVALIGLRADGESRRIGVGRQNDRDDVQPVFPGEVEVALVMGGAAEDRAGAIVHEHEVGDIDRQAHPRPEGMDGLQAGVVALLLGGLDRGKTGSGMPRPGDEVGELRVFLGKLRRQRMVGRDRQKTRAEEGVVARGEDFDRVAVGTGIADDGEADAEALRLADPVPLHEADFFGPAVETVDRRQQVLGIGGDAEEPLGELALLDRRAGTPAAAVDHLLVGENRLIDRIPVDLRLLAVGEVGSEHVEKQLLLHGVILEVAGREFARPVERQSHELELAAHDGDVVVGPALRVDAVLHGRVLGRQAEGVPAHGMEDVVALRPHIAGNNVAHRVVADVAHMDAPRRIGEHLEDVIARPLILVRRLEDAVVGPSCLPARLRLARIVAFRRHSGSYRPSPAVPARRAGV